MQLDLQFVRISQALYAPGGFLGKAQTRLLADTVVKACDAADGLADNIVSNPDACHFDPASLLCSANPQRGCLSPAQLHTVETYATAQHTAQPLWRGIDTMPGFNILAGADLTGTLGILHRPLHPARPLLSSFPYLVGDQVLRFFLTRNPHFNALRFDTTTGGQYARDLLPQSRDADASDSNLAPYFAHGGKLLLLHGTADATIPTASTTYYWQLLARDTPAALIAANARFYLVPGYGHGHGAPFQAGFDALGTLDRWLDGTAPENLTVVDNDRPARTRPLCSWPGWPRYVAGPPDSAHSFTCTAADPAPQEPRIH